MVKVSAKILYNKKIKKNYYEMCLSAPEIAKSALPGQFVNIKVAEEIEPLLRRPFSIHQIYRKGGIKILYEAIGKGSEALAKRKSGELLDTIGPLGNGFGYDGIRNALPAGRNAECPACRQAGGMRILVAGGMGTAPLVFLAEKLARNTRFTASKKLLVLLGAKTTEDIFCEKEFKEFGCEVQISTDDGSRGFKGYISDLLLKILSTIDHQPSTIYACGPTPMLKEISRISKGYDIPAQISLEAHMACGIGACMGCVIKVRNKNSMQNALLAGRQAEYEYRRVCKDGPVFEASRVIWD